MSLTKEKKRKEKNKTFFFWEIEILMLYSSFLKFYFYFSCLCLEIKLLYLGLKNINIYFFLFLNSVKWHVYLNNEDTFCIVLEGQSVGFWGVTPSLDKLETWPEFSHLQAVKQKSKKKLNQLDKKKLHNWK